MKITGTLALAAALAIASTMAVARTPHGDRRSGPSYHDAWERRAVALPQGPSAAEQAWFRRASRSWGGGGY